MAIRDLNSEDQDKAKAESILTAIALPPEIVRTEIRTGADFSGDPAMWVVLWVDKDLNFDKAKAKMLNKAAEEVQTKMLNGGFARFPYVTLDQAA